MAYMYVQVVHAASVARPGTCMYTSKVHVSLAFYRVYKGCSVGIRVVPYYPIWVLWKPVCELITLYLNVDLHNVHVVYTNTRTALLT